MESASLPETSTGKVIAVYDGNGLWTFESAEHRARLHQHILTPGNGTLLIEVMRDGVPWAWVKGHPEDWTAVAPPEVQDQRRKLLEQALAGTAKRAKWRWL